MQLMRGELTQILGDSVHADAVLQQHIELCAQKSEHTFLGHQNNGSGAACLHQVCGLFRHAAGESTLELVDVVRAVIIIPVRLATAARAVAPTLGIAPQLPGVCFLLRVDEIVALNQIGPALGLRRFYGLKGEIVGRGVERLLGFELPRFPKRRFQEGATSTEVFSHRFGVRPETYRQHFLDLYTQ